MAYNSGEERIEGLKLTDISVDADGRLVIRNPQKKADLAAEIARLNANARDTEGNNIWCDESCG